jgi:hypothetical protein
MKLTRIVKSYDQPKNPTETSTMLFDSNPGLAIFLILMGALISVPIISYSLVYILDWLWPGPVIDMERPADIPLGIIGEISS